MSIYNENSATRHQYYPDMVEDIELHLWTKFYLTVKTLSDPARIQGAWSRFQTLAEVHHPVKSVLELQRQNKHGHENFKADLALLLH